MDSESPDGISLETHTRSFFLSLFHPFSLSLTHLGLSFSRPSLSQVLDYAVMQRKTSRDSGQRALLRESTIGPELLHEMLRFVKEPLPSLEICFGPTEIYSWLVPLWSSHILSFCDLFSPFQTSILGGCRLEITLKRRKMWQIGAQWFVTENLRCSSQISSFPKWDPASNPRSFLKKRSSVMSPRAKLR